MTQSLLINQSFDMEQGDTRKRKAEKRKGDKQQNCASSGFLLYSLRQLHEILNSEITDKIVLNKHAVMDQAIEINSRLAIN